MNRRQFVSSLVGAAGGFTQTNRMRRGQDIQTSKPDVSVKRVLVIFKCHLDIGFVDTQAAVINKYFKQYFPLAMRIASAMRQSGEERYVWTTGSWLVFEYLEQASAQERQQMEQAIEHGDIAWHALPFSWQTELLDRSAIAGAIGFSKSLDRRFGRTTTGAKMTDVPGHSRGLIDPLAKNGVKLLDIGVNSASTPPDVPPVFLWKGTSGSSLIMMYHRHEYGGVVQVPGSDLAVAIEVRNDNSGPHTEEEIRAIYSNLRQQFPNAAVRASNLTEVANAVNVYENSLPIVTQEIGDTWIYGVPSDPVKVARYREMLRLRSEWISQGKFAVADAVDLAFLGRFALAAEHTWGTDTKTWLDFEHYAPDALARMLDQPNYKTVTSSWLEKRGDIDEGIETLPPALRAEAQKRLSRLKPIAPDTSILKVHDASIEIQAKHFTIGLDPATGALVRLQHRLSKREWASTKHPLALFSYQTLSKNDYDHFLASYITVQTDWAPKDFGKPNIEKFGAKSRMWTTKLTHCFSGENAAEHRVVIRLQIEDAGGALNALTAWPQEIFLEVVLSKSQPTVLLNLTWFGKRANRLPEAIWLTFNPNVSEPQNWILSKVEQSVSPGDVVSGGNRHMHALSTGLSYKDERGTLAIDTLDAPVVALGEKSPIYFSNSQPDMSKGIHFSLFNNGWGTNYIQWFGEDAQFRFAIRA